MSTSRPAVPGRWLAIGYTAYLTWAVLLAVHIIRGPGNWPLAIFVTPVSGAMVARTLFTRRRRGQSHQQRRTGARSAA